jgi:hypothetical protein
MRLRTFVAAGALVIATQAGGASPLTPLTEGNTVGGMSIIPVHNTCHSDSRTHGGSYPLHHHRQSNCRVVIDEDDDEDDDCHHDVIRHFLPGYGKVWHRHRRSDCGIQIYEEGDDDPTPGVGGCIQIGPVTVCP